jgi:hypothetical protein
MADLAVEMLPDTSYVSPESRGDVEQRKLIAENRRGFQEEVRESGGRWKHEYAYWETLAWP